MYDAQGAEQVRGFAYAARPYRERGLHREHRPHELLLLHLQRGRVQLFIHEPIVVDEVLDVFVHLDEFTVVGVGEEPVRHQQLRGGLVAIRDEHLLAGFVAQMDRI